MRYFSYGLTVSEVEMDQACPGAKCLGPAVLMSHELRFAGPTDVVLHLHHNVDGIVWEIPEEYIDMVTAYERHDMKRQLMIKHQGDTKRAWVSYKRMGTPPQQADYLYWQDIRDAYEYAGLPWGVLDKAVEVTDYYIDLNNRE